MHRITITGVTGNLGWKLLCHFVRLPQITGVVGVSRRAPSDEQLLELRSHQGHDKAEFVQSDLTDFNAEAWREVVARSDAVVHFAAQNPFPEATWDDASKSFDMTLNVALAAVDAGVNRFVFASSNHVMGRYKDPPLADSMGPGKLTTALEHGVGTVWHTGITPLDSTVYAAAKSAGERLCRTLAIRSGGKTGFVCTRIGWCQPGENSPATLSSAGTPTTESPAEGPANLELAKTDRWFKMIWLSNRDFNQLHTKSVFASSINWPEPCIVVNAMSDNENMSWSLEEARNWLGYEPDDGLALGRLDPPHAAGVTQRGTAHPVSPT